MAPHAEVIPAATVAGGLTTKGEGAREQGTPGAWYRTIVSRRSPMSLPSIAVINFTSTLNDQVVQKAVRAVNRQVMEDFAPTWGYGRVLRLQAVDFSPLDPDTLAPQKVSADSAIYLVDEASLPGALGFHDLNTRDMPVGFVFVLDPNDWTVTLSHEVLELILDPTVNIFVPGPDPRNAT